MEAIKAESPMVAIATTTSSAPGIPTNRLATTTAVRPDKPILEMPKLVPVTDPKPSMEASQQQQSILKKSVISPNTATTGSPNFVQIVPRIPIKTIQGPNGNIIVQGPHNKILSLQIKTSHSVPPSSLVPITIAKEQRTAMMKFSGVTSIQARKIASKEPSTLLISSKNNTSKELASNLKSISKSLTITPKSQSKPPTSLFKLTPQEAQALFKPKDPSTAPKLSPIITDSLSTATSHALNTLVSSKALEIKPITVTDSPKALTPAQAATVPITSTNLLSKLNAVKSDASVSDSVTIEKKSLHKLQPMKMFSSNKDQVRSLLGLTPQSNKMINLQISNGKLSDPNGPIKLISANNMTTKEQPDKPLEKTVAGKSDTSVSEPSMPLQTDRTESVGSKTPSPPQGSRRSSLEKNTSSENESLLQLKQNMQKQQSLLRNKTVEILQRSPRTKCRSKSLNALNKRLKNKNRKLSAASDGDVKKSSSQKATVSPSVSTTPPEMQVNKLLCPEKISTSSDSVGSSSPTEEKIVVVPINYAPTEIIEMNSSEDECKLVEDSLTPPPQKTNENEVYSCMNWQDGVGSLKESHLQFQFNEFGLIEILETGLVKSELNFNYEKPIFEREFKSQKTLDYSNPYFCKGCNCKGAAVDFLTPEFCSRECIRKYNTRMKRGVLIKPTKKYSNRKKFMNQSEELKEDALEIKPDLSLLRPNKIFQWETYLNNCKGNPTPIDLFLNPFPCSSNLFQEGMKLEAIDPEHSSLFCVCTIMEKKGYRLKLRFDGYSKFYDFWVNADSMDIFPPGWCAKTNRTLQPPRGISPTSFNWPKYLNQTKTHPAPRNLFTHLNSLSQSHGFKVGMKIEADDLRNSGKVCVATVADILDNRLLILFDDWDDSYSYWIDIYSPYIHPVNWHKKHGFSIVPPPDYQNKFSWATYLANTESEPATESLFRTRDPIDFKPGMKLEVVDRRNPSLIRPASVIMTDDYEIKVLFEGWPMEYAIWIEDDSPDIHPIGWCEITNHELETPPGFDSLPSRYDCKFPGCRGIGNALHPELGVHTNIMSCPYEPANWTKEIDKSDRLSNYSRYDSTYTLNTKDISRNKRKAEQLPYPPVHAKLPKHQLPSYTQHTQNSSGVQIPQSKDISLLVNKIEKSDTNIDTRVNIARHLLCDYGPRLQQVYSLWKQNSECLAVNLAEKRDHCKNPLEWSANEVAEYIAKLPRCQTIAQEFSKQDIDGSAFLAMRQGDLTEIMKIKLGPAIKIYNQIVQLREEVITRFMSTPRLN